MHFALLLKHLGRGGGGGDDDGDDGVHSDCDVYDDDDDGLMVIFTARCPTEPVL